MILPTKLHREKGLTLLEILVSMSLLVVITLGLTTMFSQTQKVFKRGLTHVDMMEGGRATFDLMVRGMQEISACGVSNEVNLEVISTAFVPPPNLFSNLDNGTLQNLFFLVKNMENKWEGHGYWVSNSVVLDDSKNPKTGVGSLYYFRTTRLISQPSLCYQDFLRELDPARDENNKQSVKLLDGIVHMRVRAYDTSGVVYRQTNSTPALSTNSVIVDVESNSTLKNPNIRMMLFKNQSLPRFVELELGVLEDQTLTQLKGVGVNAERETFLYRKSDRIHLFRQQIPIRTVSR